MNVKLSSDNYTANNTTNHNNNNKQTNEWWTAMYLYVLKEDYNVKKERHIRKKRMYNNEIKNAAKNSSPFLIFQKSNYYLLIDYIIFIFWYFLKQKVNKNILKPL